MKKYTPDEMMPDKFTDVLGYFGGDYGYIVTKYSGSQWLDSWSDDVICDVPYHWIDLTDIESNIK